jgi:hypothetical protein
LLKQPSISTTYPVTLLASTSQEAATTRRAKRSSDGQGGDLVAVQIAVGLTSNVVDTPALAHDARAMQRLTVGIEDDAPIARRGVNATLLGFLADTHSCPRIRRMTEQTIELRYADSVRPRLPA